MDVVRGYVHMSAGALRSQKRAAEVAGVCKVSNMMPYVRKPTLFLCERYTYT